MNFWSTLVLLFIWKEFYTGENKGMAKMNNVMEYEEQGKKITFAYKKKHPQSSSKNMGVKDLIPPYR